MPHHVPRDEPNGTVCVHCGVELRSVDQMRGECPKHPRVEWVRRTDFAEVAEAIGIDSDLVISATERPYGLLVLWAASDADHEPIMGSALLRDDDGIYRVVKGGPTGTTLGDWISHIKRDMGIS